MNFDAGMGFTVLMRGVLGSVFIFFTYWQIDLIELLDYQFKNLLVFI
jgi:hypothetical protein